VHHRFHLENGEESQDERRNRENGWSHERITRFIVLRGHSGKVKLVGLR